MSEHRPSCPQTPHLTSTVLVIQEAEELSKSEGDGNTGRSWGGSDMYSEAR